MKIVIVENPRPLTIEHYNDVANAPLSASLNSGYALAVSREAGWDTAYLDFTSSCEDEAVMADRILAENADIILFHWVYAWGKDDALLRVLDLLKASDVRFMGAFGLFPTLAHERLVPYAPQLDFIMVGEFEETLRDLLHNFRKTNQITTLPGIFQTGQTFKRRELIPDLSRLPVPDDVGTNCAFSTMNIAASRGCFGDCSFCFINLYYGCQRRRERSIASFGQELELRMKRRDIRNIYFIDPTFVGHGNGQKSRVKEMSGILKGNNLSFGFETRVDTIDEDLVETLAKNGATTLFLGIESGCDAVLQRINKRINKKQITRAVRCIQNSGINLSAGFIMFEPDTTLDELLENYSFLQELGLLSHHDLTINMLYHSQIVLYGSKAWKRFAGEDRLILDEKLPFEASYRFKDGNVARVCHAMRRLSSEYFICLNRLYGPGGMGGERHGCRHTEVISGFNEADVNMILKQAFLAFCRHAGRCDVKQFSAFEETYIEGLRSCFQ